MKAAVWNDKGTLDVVERPMPQAKPGWIRLRVAAVGICGTDLHFHRGAFPSPAGLQPGHEIGGVVDAIGAGVSLATGTAVAVDLFRKQHRDLGSLVTHRFPLDEINGAFDAAGDKRSGSIKVHVLPGGL